MIQYKSGNFSFNSIGSRAEETIYTYFKAIPLRGFYCSNEGEGKLFNFIIIYSTVHIWYGFLFNELYFFLACLNAALQASSSSLGTGCNDCTKRLFGRIVRFRDSHPLDTPTLQNNTYFKNLEKFEQECPIPKEYLVDSTSIGVV